MAPSGLSTVLAGLLAINVTVAALIIRGRWQGAQRPPVTEKLLRSPGERLRQAIERIDQRLPWLLLAVLLVPLLILCAGLALRHQLSADGALALTIATGLLFVGLTGAGGWLLHRLFNERRDRWRALQGERAVAESLATLIPAGYRVFHDVPTGSANPDDNLHHVVVGPAGAFAVQTQNPRRRKPLPGRKEHEIVFDGDQLVYPWGQNTEGLVSARQKGEWLSQWIYQLVGERLPVSALLTFPGWWVTPITQREVRVFNPSQIASLILDLPAGQLNDRQCQQIVRQLDQRCRDVEF
jgi:hypothetical protein